MPEQSALRRWLQSVWYDRRPAPAWLRGLSVLHGVVAGARQLAWRRGWRKATDTGVPVVVVGNLTVGGTGKTPLVRWLAVQLREAGLRPGIVLRGHGGAARSARLVKPDDSPALVGDEAVMLAGDGMCPVAIGVRRAAAARLLAAQGCNVVLSDDGLQHLAMRRALEVVVVDGARGFGNGALLPAGPLREPAQALHRADLVVMHGDDEQGVAAGIGTLAMHLVPGGLREVATGRATPMESLSGKAVHAVAGTGNPQRFFAQLRGLGLQPVEHAFADHHGFRASDLAFGDDLPIVMTEKDAVKCRAFATRNMYWLPVVVTFAEADAARLLQRIIAVTTMQGGNRA